MKTKNILITAGVAIGAIALLGYRKATNLQYVFERMTITPAGVRNVKLTNFGSLIKFELDVKLTNPTSQAFAVNGMVATLRALQISYKGKHFGDAFVNIDEISIPPYNSLVIKNLPVSVQTTTVLDSLSTISSVNDLMNIININDIKITAIIEALGTEYTITQ